MDNYNNLIDPNIEYSNIVYGGVGGGGGAIPVQQLHIENEQQQQTQQNPELLLPQQQIEDHPQPVIIDGVNSEIKPTNLDDLNRQTIIQTSTNHENDVYHNEIEAVNPPILENHTNYPAEEEEDKEVVVTPAADNSNTSNIVETEHLNNNDDNKSDEMAGENETKVPVTTETKIVAPATTTTTNKTKTTETNNNTKKDEEVDPNQCRVCLSKDDLIDIFLVEEANLRFSDKIIVICPNVRIIKNDYLPHFICTTCLQNLKIAYEFKKLCENTDNELRKKLKRSKNKLRRPTEFILIDCDDFSESSDDNKNPDDDEFHLSGSLSEADTSGSDYSTEKKRRRPPRRRAAATRSNRSASKRSSNNSTSKRKRSSRTSGGGGGGGNSSVEIKKEDVSPVAEKRTRREIVLIKAADDSDEEDDLPLKQRSTKSTPAATKSKTAPKAVTPKPDAKPNICPYCDKVFPSQSQLREHKKVHSQDTPYICGNCTKEFKQKSNFTAHIMKHKDLSTGKMSCEKPKPKQSRTSGGGGGGNGGGGGGSSSSSTQKTVGGGGSSGGGAGAGGGGGGGGSSGGDKKKKSEFEMTNFGRDLFKCVAPLTTTYWSDSFSD